MIDFDATFKDLEGQDVKERIMGSDNKMKESVTTLGKVSANALLAMTDDDKALSGEVKVKRYDLAIRVIKGKHSLTAEDISEIKAAIGRHYAPIIVGQAWRMLDPGEKKK